jgi:hypothetical protein
MRNSEAGSSLEHIVTLEEGRGMNFGRNILGTSMLGTKYQVSCFKFFRQLECIKWL